MGFFVSLLFICSFLLVCWPPKALASSSLETQKKYVSGENAEWLTNWRRSLAVSEDPSASNSSLTNTSYILAAKRTYRRDPLENNKKYTGGWNISNGHYWASVGFTAAPLFVIALVWFVLFGLSLFTICIYHFCCSSRNYSYSRTAYALSLILLVLFTISSIVGSIVLYTGQGKFHESTTNTLDYVVEQANYTVDNLRNFSNSLAAAKNIGVDRAFLPANVLTEIDSARDKLNSSTNSLASRTADNSQKIRKVLNRVRLALIIVAAVMLFVAFIGFLLSIFGLQFLVSILVIIGWILVAGTFILCGVFLILHNVTSDTCVAMGEWVNHPTEHTALDDILPCVDKQTANESMYKGRDVTFQLVNLVNNVISNVSNQNIPPSVTLLYYNQSGPLMPLLCNPYSPDLNNRSCTAGEVDFTNATQVWKGYECQTKVVSGTEICTNQGRVTPTIYNQMVAAVNVSSGVSQYGPFLYQLEDCTFVRDTFTSINSSNCPGLERYSKMVYIGLVMVSAAVMLSLIFWVIYARERKHRKYNKDHGTGPGHGSYPVRDK